MFNERFIKNMSVRKEIVCFPSCKMGKVVHFRYIYYLIFWL